VVEAAHERVPHVLEVQPPRAQQVVARRDGEHVGRAGRQEAPGPRQGELHDVARMVTGRMAQPVVRRCDLECRQVVVHAEVHARTATARRGDDRRERAAAVGTENRPRRLDHQLEGKGTRCEIQPRLEVVEQAYQGRHFLRVRHLRQRDREMRGQRATASLDQRRHE